MIKSMISSQFKGITFTKLNYWGQWADSLMTNPIQSLIHTSATWIFKDCNYRILNKVSINLSNKKFFENVIQHWLSRNCLDEDSLDEDFLDEDSLWVTKKFQKKFSRFPVEKHKEVSWCLSNDFLLHVFEIQFKFFNF